MKSVGISFAVRTATFPITAIATLLSTALVIGYTGAVDYGVVMLAATLFQLIPFADLGLGAVVVNVLSQPGHSRSHREQTIGAVWRLLVISGLLVAAVGACGMLLFSWSTLLGVSDSILGFDGWTALALAIFGLSIPFGLGQRILIGVGRNPIAIGISSTSSVVTLLAVVAVIGSGAPAGVVILTTPIGILVSSLISFVVARRAIELPWRVITTKSDVSAGSLVNTALPMLIVMIGLPIAMQSGRIFLSHVGEPIALSQFTLGMQLYTPAWSFVAVAAMALWPIFAATSQDQHKSRELFTRSAISFAAVGVLGGLAIAFLGPWVASLVSSGALPLTFSVTAPLGLLLFVQTIQQLPGMYLTTPAGLRFQAICVALLVVTTMAGYFAFTPILGATAPPLVLALGVLICQVCPGLVRVARELKRPSK